MLKKLLENIVNLVCGTPKPEAIQQGGTTMITGTVSSIALDLD
jgi:hypothetical protein